MPQLTVGQKMKKPPLILIRLSGVLFCAALIAWSVLTQQTIGNEGSIIRGPSFESFDRSDSPAGFIVINALLVILGLIFLLFPEQGIKRKESIKKEGSLLQWSSEGFFSDLFGSIDSMQMFVVMFYPVVIILSNSVTLDRFLWVSSPFAVIVIVHTAYMLLSLPKKIRIEESKLEIAYRLLPLKTVQAKEIEGIRDSDSSITIDTGYTTAVSIPLRLFSPLDKSTIKAQIKRVQPVASGQRR